MTAALILMLASQALVVVASLTLPVLAPTVAADLGVRADQVGFYSAILFGGAFAAVLATPAAVERYGAVRVSQATLVLAALGLLLLPAALLPALVLSALLIGLGYGPGNPASSFLLARTTPAHLRGQVFSIKQTSVPLGGALAGFAMPLAAARFGWPLAVTLLAGLCLAAACLMQPWRAGLDAGRDPAAPLLPRRALEPLRLVLTRPRLRRLAIMAAGLASGQFSFSALWVSFTVAEAALDQVAAGWALSLALGVSVAARIFWGWLADRSSGRAVLCVIAVAIAAAWLTCLLVTPAWPYPAVLLLGALFGASIFSWNGVYLAQVAAAVPAAEVARATSGTMIFVFLGGLAGPAVFSALLTVTGSYAPGLLLLALVTLIAAFAVPKELTAEARLRP